MMQKSLILVALLCGVVFSKGLGSTKAHKLRYSNVEHVELNLNHNQVISTKEPYYSSNVDIVGCEKYGANKAVEGCNTCYVGYARAPTTTDGFYACTKCSDGCKYCTTPDSCDECHDSFFKEAKTSLTEGDAKKYQCSKCKSDCMTCQTGEYCDKCLPGMYKTEGAIPKCVKCIEHCEKCDNEVTCLQCGQLFPASDDNTQCVDREGNSTKFYAFYGVVAIFGLVTAILFGLFWILRASWDVCLKRFACCRKIDLCVESVCPCLKDVHDDDETQQLNSK